MLDSNIQSQKQHAGYLACLLYLMSMRREPVGDNFKNGVEMRRMTDHWTCALQSKSLTALFIMLTTGGKRARRSNEVEARPPALDTV
jgi:hypothetical protein